MLRIRQKLINITMLAVMIITLCTLSVYAVELSNRAQKAEDSVVGVDIITNFGTESKNGIYLGENEDIRYIIMPYHSIDGAWNEVTVKKNDADYKGYLKYHSEAYDICVIEVYEEISGVKAAKLLNKKLENNTEVFALGISEITVGKAEEVRTVKLKDDLMPIEIYKITDMVNENNDGGALINKSGAVVGMLSYNGNAEQNYALTGTSVAEYLASNNIPYKVANNTMLIVMTVISILMVIAIAVIIIYCYRKKRENRPMLLGVVGEFAGQAIPVTSEKINIGRDAKQCQIVLLNSGIVSRCHCCIYFDVNEDDFVISDLSSVHGTYISGDVRLEPKKPIHIARGSEFYVGNTANIFRVQ